MALRFAGSQWQDVMHEKREVARALLARGLRIHQVAVQLNCSRQVVRRVRNEMICGVGAPESMAR